ncbi:MAG: peroxiredoxin Q/BCP [Sulfitobacter sp.]|jgi:peroxiredoxin Q/BCP
MIEIGQPAPEVSLPRDGGETVTLTDIKPKAVVLYFYPKDDTPGCTKEAIAFTALREEFEASGAIVFGISKDPVKKHDKFVAKYELQIPLLSDEDGDVCERYGTWVEKNMYGKKYMGIERTTVLIDGTGTLAQIWRKVKVPGHAEAVLDAVRAL